MTSNRVWSCGRPKVGGPEWVEPDVPVGPSPLSHVIDQSSDRCRRNDAGPRVPDMSRSATVRPYHSQLPGLGIGRPAAGPDLVDVAAARTRGDHRKDLRSDPSLGKILGPGSDGVWVSLVGARPKGPRPDLKDGPQKTLLTRLNELNNPYRVSYEMVARQRWPDQGPPGIHRSRTRDLSRQFRGEKAIEWRVVEIYVKLLLGEADSELATELELLRDLHGQAFGSTVEPDGAPSPEPETPPVDPAYVAELERQLEEARNRASFATALLVIVQAENTSLRGRNTSFDWFGQRPRPGDTPAPAADTAPRPRAGRRAAGTRPGTDTARPADPVTTPIRRQSYRAAPPPRRRAALADTFPPPAPTDESSVDLLVSREKRRRGKHS